MSPTNSIKADPGDEKLLISISDLLERGKLVSDGVLIDPETLAKLRQDAGDADEDFYADLSDGLVSRKFGLEILVQTFTWLLPELQFYFENPNRQEFIYLVRRFQLFLQEALINSRNEESAD